MHRPARISRRSSAPPAIWLMSCTAVLLCAQLPKSTCVASFTLGQCENLLRKGRTVRHLVQLKGGVLGAGGVQDGLGALAEGAAAPAEHHHLRLGVGRARLFRSGEQYLAATTTACRPQRQHRSTQERRGCSCGFCCVDRAAAPAAHHSRQVTEQQHAGNWVEAACSRPAHHCPNWQLLLMRWHWRRHNTHTTVRSCISGGFRHAQRTGLSAMYLSIARHARDLELYRVVQVLAQ